MTKKTDDQASESTPKKTNADRAAEAAKSAGQKAGKAVAKHGVAAAKKLGGKAKEGAKKIYDNLPEQQRSFVDRGVWVLGAAAASGILTLNLATGIGVLALASMASVGYSFLRKDDSPAGVKMGIGGAFGAYALYALFDGPLGLLNEAFAGGADFGDLYQRLNGTVAPLAVGAVVAHSHLEVQKLRGQAAPQAQPA